MKPRCAKEGCTKKLKLTDPECRCGYRYCVNHRVGQEHQCSSLENEQIKHKKELEQLMKPCTFQKIDTI